MKQTVGILLFLSSLLFFSCAPEAKISEPKKPNISSEYWGTWIRMDTGDYYYINSDYVYEYRSSKYYSISNSISGYTLQTENVLKKGSIVYFRKGGVPRDFSLQVSGFSDSIDRAAASARAGIKVTRKSEYNEDDTEVVISSDNGIINFKGAVADDPQTITVEDSSVSITPKYNGETSGTIPIVEKGMYGFKTTYSIDSDNQGYCYGSYYKDYKLELNINNIGNKTCETSVYTISCDDPKLDFVSGDLSGNFSSIEAGKSKALDFTVRYAQVDSEYVDVPIKISITDSKYGRTWNDSVTLRFYKGVVALKVNSRNFDSNSSAKLKGFIIYPDGRSKRFEVSTRETSSVLVPWSQKDYILAFSGATAENEMAYSFGFEKTTSLADLSGTWSINDINAYENNDSAGKPFAITDLSQPVKAYLKSGDIDFYKINNKEIDIGFKPVTIVTSKIGDETTISEKNNGDGIVNCGETINLDIRVQNTTGVMISGITAKLSTTSKYITIAEDKKSYGNIAGEYYKTIYGNSEYATGNYKDGYYSNYEGYSSSLVPSYGWQFTVASDTPSDTAIPFTLTLTDSRGNTWTEEFTYTVEKVGVDLEIVAKEISDATSIDTNNNGDGKVNSCEVIKMDVRLHNKGSTLAQGITGVISTESPYITINQASKSYGNIKGEYYKTIYGNSEYATGNYKDGYYSNYEGYSSSLVPSYGWQFTVASDTPSGTTIPFTLTLTDSRGNTWTQSIEFVTQ